MSDMSQILVKLRKERGWSQEKLAAISGISERTIQRLENSGSCSLETKMALSSAFEISPSELSKEQEHKNSNIEYKTDWSGAFGLLILGLATPAIILVTSTNGAWEVSSSLIVIGLTVVLSITSHGVRETYRLFDNTSWIVKFPTYVSGLNNQIAHAKVVVESAYIVGLVGSLAAGLSIAIYGADLLSSPSEYVAIVIRPVVYAILFSEFWFRPYKRKMEKMLRNQLGGVS